ncbi:alkaline phosphatase family protein [Actinotalea sp. M2MS4P-6]|uniref:alkaline phosphatase family protein n=1 Tax=Actinotalea sp. M2MS4P-6 TaxID=2983762 RepID=UPI0021E51474|nr:alkaline phosphatase family protein [Actinotalea sp. M2MS4P-6]MCV2394831.1 alkaline phosphatase family protein [Actinotalea sp. M2MS4P-6]
MDLRITQRDVRNAVLGTCATAIALLVTAWMVHGLVIDDWWAALLVALLVGLLDALVRPRLRPLARLVGVPGTLLLGLVFQLGVLRLSLAVVPGVEVDGWGATLATFAVVGIVTAVARWLVGAEDRDYLVADLMRRSRRTRAGGDSREPGLVVIQIDGLAYPVLQHAIGSGDAPTLARWLRRGSHTARPWWARVPSTTPASQAGLLHGTNDGIPAFRWYDKEAGRLVVTNHPADAAIVEEHLSDGRGLLADGGAAVSTMFTGDAESAFLVMSRAGRRGGLGTGSSYLRFFARPFVLGRALLLTFGEMIKELTQAWHQRRRDVWPRVPRRGAYVALRAVTNVLMRDLNVALVADQMARGAPVVFVDLVDYDEIAHHAGVVRREALDALAGVDAAIGTLERFAEVCPREYRFVVLSDHGQSQGATFAQLAGRSLEAVVTELTSGSVAGHTGTEEVWGPLATLLSDVLSASGARGRWARWTPGADGLERDARSEPTDGGTGPTATVVAASGNLGLIWFPTSPGRVTLEDVAERHPALLPGLLAEPGVGFCVVDTAQGPLAVGHAGVHRLTDGRVEGEDPLASFGPRARTDLLRVTRMANAPDVLVHSTYDAQTGEVHAFEELVGSHGGLGGDQNLAMLLHPVEWAVDEDLLDDSVPGERVLCGAETVHAQLVRWLRSAGLREEVVPEEQS